MKDEQGNEIPGKVLPFGNDDSVEKQPGAPPESGDAPTASDGAEAVEPGAESPEMAELTIALALMPNGRVMFMKPEIATVREANDEDILSLLERGKRQLERMITISTIRGAINEGIQGAANIGAMSAVQFMADKAKGGNILVPR